MAVLEIKLHLFYDSSPPEENHITGHVKKALEAAELLVVQDIFLTPTAKMAHVVIPGTSFAEKDGTFTNTERRARLNGLVLACGVILTRHVICQLISLPASHGAQRPMGHKGPF